jgi:hypothetical protein
MEAHAEHHLAMPRQRCVTRGQGALNGDGTLHGLHDTGELGQQIIAGIVHHPAPILPDERRHEATIGS